jgi:hypothetical protein
VVLILGFVASSVEPRVVAVAERLARAGIDGTGYDAHGHGSSGDDATLGDLERLDVAAAAPATETDPVVLVGTSGCDPCRIAVVDGLGHTFEVLSIGPILNPVDWILESGTAGR